jgi:hypothetical protein
MFDKELKEKEAQLREALKDLTDNQLEAFRAVTEGEIKLLWHERQKPGGMILFNLSKWHVAMKANQITLKAACEEQDHREADAFLNSLKDIFG